LAIQRPPSGPDALPGTAHASPDALPGAAHAGPDALPGTPQPGSAALAAGDARLAGGAWDEALAAFERATSAGAPASATAWRIGLVHHLRGELDRALEAYGDASGPPADRALTLAWRSSTHWLRGDAGHCRADADASLLAAQAAAEPRALAAAHTAQALLAALDGDRRANELHYDIALRHAERAGDRLQILRIRANRGSRCNEEGAYAEAIDELDAALASAGPGAPAPLEGLALTNRAEAAVRLGRLDEALADLAAARASFQAAGSRMVAYTLTLSGDIHHERGELALARAAGAEALHLGEESGDLQAIVPALTGLAMTALEEGDVEAAAALAERALALEPQMAQVSTLLAAGAAALAGGDAPRAARHAEEAIEAASRRRDRPGLAAALEAAAQTRGGEAAIDLLEQSIGIWQAVGNPLGEAKAMLALAAAVGEERGRALAAEAEQRLLAGGARRHAARAARVRAALDRAAPAPVAVECLGAFRVLVHGTPLPAGAWGSRKARDLLKLLIARRGQPVPREALIEALWPGEDPVRTAPRLSVALSTLRRVLDPERRLGTDSPVVGSRSALRLDESALELDVERFLALAQRSLEPAGGAPSSLEDLLAAEGLYKGDFLEEDLYEDWTAILREEARDAYVGVVRRLAERFAAAGDHEAASRRFLRILERDAYDERAHLGLIGALAAAGRHGEARRRYALYLRRMQDVGVPAAPFPSR
jgi:DNA-binding SARP family transcriptional activator